MYFFFPEEVLTCFPVGSWRIKLELSFASSNIAVEGRSGARSLWEQKAVRKGPNKLFRLFSRDYPP